MRNWQIKGMPKLYIARVIELKFNVIRTMFLFYLIRKSFGPGHSTSRINSGHIFGRWQWIGWLSIVKRSFERGTTEPNYEPTFVSSVSKPKQRTLIDDYISGCQTRMFVELIHRRSGRNRPEAHRQLYFLTQVCIWDSEWLSCELCKLLRWGL